MPFKSEAQRRAMYAAASGHSTIGIPQSVGEKFVEHGKKDSAESPKTELDIARAIRDGKLSSPQVYENVALFDLRITGTGLPFFWQHLVGQFGQAHLKFRPAAAEG